MAWIAPFSAGLAAAGRL